MPAEIRITGAHEFYDFEAKYLPEEATALDLPADLPDEVGRAVRELSARAFEAVGCEGLARVDFFVAPDGSLVLNEINTMPGFTPTSMYPQMWAAIGRRLPGARRPAAPARAGPRHRPALRREEGASAVRRAPRSTSALVSAGELGEVRLDRGGELGDRGGRAVGAVVVRAPGPATTGR